MTAIKEYPFDFSDLKYQQNDMNDKNLQQYFDSNMDPTQNNQEKNPPSILILGERKISRVSNGSRKVSSGERKVSIMADEPPCKENNTLAETNGRVANHHVDGPARRKSILHNSIGTENDTSWDRQSHIEGRYKKYSTTSTIYSKRAQSLHSEQIESSWWYACCQKCHQEDNGIPSWEPPKWRIMCPYPFCPSFRKFARVFTICTIVIIAWLTVWMIVGESAAPGGQMFMLAALTIAAHLGGVLVLTLTTLPALLGMLLMGIICKNVGLINFNHEYHLVISVIRKMALTILLIRAGMDMDPHSLKKHFLTVNKLSVLPWTFEFLVCALMSYYLLALPWEWAFLLGAIIAAVSPAVIVPCLMALRKNGYGVAKGIPTLVLAVSGIDDAISVAVFDIMFSVMFSGSSLTMSLVQGPISVVVGIGAGVFLGYLLKYVPERNDSFMVPMRVLFVLFGGLICMFGFDEIGWGGGGPLAVITLAFVANKNWSDLGWDFEDNPVVTNFEILWMFFEPMLFSVTGAEVVISQLPGKLVGIGGGILVTCMVLRAAFTSLCAVRSRLNMKEKLFVGLAWMAKATVQAALGPVALHHILNLGDNEKNAEIKGYAEIVSTICILSIIITAPIGAIVITFAGPKLLTKTSKPPPILEGWRRSNRPSIRDISIIDEEDVLPTNVEDPQIPSHIQQTPKDRPSSITSQPHHDS